MAYGVTSEGFDRPSFAEIREAIASRARALLGPVNTGPESAIGQQITVQAEREALLWDALEATYNSQYPASASGRSLDGAAQLTGITRLPATRTTVVVQLSGVSGTVIPAGSQASNDNGDLFDLVQDVTLDGTGSGEDQMIAVEAGTVLALAGTVTNIETPVSGWDSVTNADDGTAGRETETDAELRQRRLESLQVTGAGTVEAIRARLRQQVDDVTAVSIIENRTDTVDSDGRPPHSFEAVVSGGVDQDVADLIWEVKPAGIETTGELTLTVLDSEGEQQTISFSRPIPLYIWMQVVLDPDNTGDFPDGYEAAVTAAIVDYGDGLEVGDDVYYQALYGPIYRNVPGLELITVSIGASVDANTEPTYAESNIEVGANEIALFDASRITVTVNDV